MSSSSSNDSTKESGVEHVSNEFVSAEPQVDESAYLAPGSVLVGAVRLEAGASVWPGAVLRADLAPIEIGVGSNVQDCAVVHVDHDCGVRVGRNVTIGHSAVVHGCTIEDDVLVGMSATILNRANIGRGSIIGAGALVKENCVVPEHSLVVGVPGKVIRTDPKMIEAIQQNAEEYHALTNMYLTGQAVVLVGGKRVSRPISHDDDDHNDDDDDDDDDDSGRHSKRQRVEE